MQVTALYLSSVTKKIKEVQNYVFTTRTGQDRTVNRVVKVEKELTSLSLSSSSVTMFETGLMNLNIPFRHPRYIFLNHICCGLVFGQGLGR